VRDPCKTQLLSAKNPSEWRVKRYARQRFVRFVFDSNLLYVTQKSGIVAHGRAAYTASSVPLLLGRLSGSDINAARHLNSLTKVALQS
jgi:hypothetical protein